MSAGADLMDSFRAWCEWFQARHRPGSRTSNAEFAEQDARHEATELPHGSNTDLAGFRKENDGGSR
jgi:hypothetical protein